MLAAFVERRALHDHQPADLLRRRHAQLARLLRGEEHAVVRGSLRLPDLAPGDADDAPDEQVEQHEKPDLECEEDLFDLDGAGRNHAPMRSKKISLDPSTITSPSSSFARFSRRPLTSVPLVESRSTT